MTKKMKLLIGVLFFVFLLLVGVNINSIKNNSKKNATIQIEVAPGDSLITIDNKRVKPGDLKVIPGKYKISVSRRGFEGQSKEIEIKENEIKYVGIGLTPNSNETLKWYEENPKDAQIAERIFSINFDNVSETKDDPILKLLPFVGPGTTYRIDYNRIDANGKVEVVISYYTRQDKEDGLLWLKNRGFDAKDYTITFINLNDDEFTRD